MRLISSFAHILPPNGWLHRRSETDLLLRTVAESLLYLHDPLGRDVHQLWDHLDLQDFHYLLDLLGLRNRHGPLHGHINNALDLLDLCSLHSLRVLLDL